MANSFSKEERVAFENILEGFNDALVLSRNVSIYNTDQAMMERSNDIIWRPMPYVAQSFSGTNQTSNFKDFTQLAVPVSISTSRSVPWTMNARELRDAMQEGRLNDSAKQKLASDINVAIMTAAANFGSLVVKRTAAASGFDDLAAADAVMNEQGIQQFDRYAALSSRDYNNMASNLANRGTMTGKPTTAYEKAYVGNIAGFETFKLDYANSLAVRAGTTVSINGANQYYTPKATSTAVTGETANVDNRFQTISITVGSGTVKVGDCFTIAGVNAVHQITKGDTGQLKTFRIVSIVTGAGGTGTVQITPPIISGGGSTDAELQYKNVTATPANGAVITFLNTATASVNPFWQKDALEILPGRYSVPADAGVAVMKASTDQGLEVVMQKQYDINTMITKYRLDVLFGVVNKQPEMSGILLFGQP
jgi:P22 coat protein - gene protein 5